MNKTTFLQRRLITKLHLSNNLFLPYVFASFNKSICITTLNKLVFKDNVLNSR